MEVYPLDPDISKKKPKDSPFRQQTMRSYRPVPTVGSAIVIFTVLGLVFLAIGSLVLVKSNEIVEVKARYDSVGECKDTDWESPRSCEVTLTVPEDTTSTTVYFYYELHNFYQNHRRYVKSKSQKQLAGENLSKGELEDCDPVITYEDLGIVPFPQGKGKDDAAYPCGLIAKTLFNDTYTMTDSSGAPVRILESDIAWESDVENKFKTIEGETPWTDVENEHFIVWMRTAGLPNFRKLWGRIENGLAKGDYTVHIVSSYDISDFDGEKYVVISTTNELGGKNEFLGIAYIVVGSLTLSVAIIFTVRKYFCKRSRS